MKIKFLFIFLFFNAIVWSQETPEAGIKKVTDDLNALIKEQQDSLQLQINKIDERIKNAEITEEDATALKQEAKENYALALEDILYEKIDSIWLKKQEIDEQVYGKLTDEEMEVEVLQDSTQGPPPPAMENPYKPKLFKNSKYKPGVKLAIGWNNMFWNNDFSTLESSPYSERGSIFIEFGFNKTIPLSKKSNLFNFVYGIDFKYSELKLFNNLYHKDLGDITVITTHSEELKKSKLTTSQILIPIEFILDFSKKSEDLKTKKGFKMGVGGYVGVNYYTTEMIKFKNSELRKQINYGNFNTNPIVYGLSGTIGFGKVALYTTYDLNTFYKNGNSNNISAGIRFDLKK